MSFWYPMWILWNVTPLQDWSENFLLRCEQRAHLTKNSPRSAWETSKKIINLFLNEVQLMVGCLYVDGTFRNVTKNYLNVYSWIAKGIKLDRGQKAHLLRVMKPRLWSIDEQIPVLGWMAPLPSNTSFFYSAIFFISCMDFSVAIFWHYSYS